MPCHGALLIAILAHAAICCQWLWWLMTKDRQYVAILGAHKSCALTFHACMKFLFRFWKNIHAFFSYFWIISEKAKLVVLNFHLAFPPTISLLHQIIPSLYVSVVVVADVVFHEIRNIYSIHFAFNVWNPDSFALWDNTCTLACERSASSATKWSNHTTFLWPPPLIIPTRTKISDEVYHAMCTYTSNWCACHWLRDKSHIYMVSVRIKLLAS